MRANRISYSDYFAHDLDLMSERREIIEELRANHSHGTIAFKTATLDHLKDAVKSTTSVIHISCHGRYRSNSFVLTFESSQTLGLCEDLSVSEIRNALKAVSPSLKVIVLSACFSQAIRKSSWTRESPA